ncbi:MAG: hypothetical protein FWD39_04180 [Clostridiales bacterium]|nr:hypothetical protein [Clostridiales bacterium]
MAQPVKAFHKSKKKKLQLLTLVVLGLALFFLITFLFGLLWGAAIYLDPAEPNETDFVPLAIYFLALFASCLLIYFLSSGFSPWPGLIVALLAGLFSLIFAGFSDVNWLLLSLKTAVGLLVAYGAFRAVVFLEKNKKTGSGRPTSPRF